jgi:hypothetical protein
MKKTLFTVFLVFVCHTIVLTQAVYVDSNNGDDKNPGVEKSPVHSIHRALEIIKSRDNDIDIVKINPGIYILDKHESVATEKSMTDKRIIIEASILPDDSSWTPEKMPVIASRARKGELPQSYHFVAAFLIEESHVTIRGIKFHGYFYPNTRYFPIARFNKAKTDLLVEQCVFVGDANISQIQVGVIAHGNEVRIDHCVFYKVRNTTVFYRDSGDGIKTGNGITNSIIYGANHAVWTAWPDKDFKFANNIVSNCMYVWIKNSFNPTEYSIENCVMVNNRYDTGMPDSVRLNPKEFKMNEQNVTKEGEVSLRLIGTEERPTLDSVDRPLPIDYLHVIPGSPGYNLGAGLFKTRRP